MLQSINKFETKKKKIYESI